MIKKLIHALFHRGCVQVRGIHVRGRRLHLADPIPIDDLRGHFTFEDGPVVKAWREWGREHN